ncbi:MAG: hypothetical protein NVS4B5_12520 [Vulcanimicrobiaceae bacterium]
MRRLALTVVAACGLASLAACGSSGGYGFSSGTGVAPIDTIVFSNGSAQANNFFVTGLGPGGVGTAPLQLSALGQRGTGPAAVVVPDQVFTWAGRFVAASDTPTTASYQVGATGVRKPCPPLPASGTPVGGTPTVPIYQQDTTSRVPPYLSYAPLPATQAAATVFVGAVPLVTPPYCLVIVATHPGDNVAGTQTVLVTNGNP